MAQAGLQRKVIHVSIVKAVMITRYPKISFCTSARNRLEHVQRTFIKNIRDNLSYPNIEFILLDYGCQQNMQRWAKRELAPFITDGLVKFFRYPSVKVFARSHARNLAFRLSSGDIFSNVDADNFCGKGFAFYVAKQMRKKNVYLCGPANGRGLMGRNAIRRGDFKKVGGYDERFVHWGMEDLDLYRRLQLLGREIQVIRGTTFLRSIMHGDKLRGSIADVERNRETASDNSRRRILSPNGRAFGLGRVKENFSFWVNVQTDTKSRTKQS